MLINPVYVNGPMLGREFPTSSPYVQTFDTIEYGVNDALSAPDPLAVLQQHILTYHTQQLGFSLGGKAAVFHVASCYGEPDMEDVIKALVQPQLLNRFEFRSITR